VGQWLNLVVLEVFSNLNDSVVVQSLHIRGEGFLVSTAAKLFASE